VSRTLTERARAAREAAAKADDKSPADIGGIVGAVQGLVDRLTAVARAGAAVKERTFSVGGDQARMVFGYTLRMGSDGVSAEPFGDVLPQNAKSAPAAPQPIVDIYQDGDWVIVIAELPGADPGDVVCHAETTTLLIEAEGGRRYRKDLVLPVPVRPDSLTRSLRNGILEVRLARAEKQ
jgi:HSP20 family protein